MLRDLRIAVRALRAWRWGALVAVLTLATGIGTTTAMYALLRVALSETSVDIEEVERVVRVYGASPAIGARRSPVTFADFETTLAGARSFERVAAYQGLEMTLGSGPESDSVSVMRVSPGFFEVLRGRAREGRLLTAADGADDARAAVVSDLMWRRRFAGRPIAEVPPIRLNGREYTVVGVLPGAFSFSTIGIAADVWLPLPRRALDGDTRVLVIARLAPAVSWASAAGELQTLDPPLRQEGSWRWEGIPVERDVRARTGGAAVFVFLPAAVVLIIGCVNVACMLLGRGIRRDTELSVRMALGASRGAIFRQLFVENCLLAVVAGTLGTALAFAGLDFVVRMMIRMKPELTARLSGDFGVLPIALTSSAAACILFGVVPALRLSRRDVAASLKGSAPAPRVRVAGYGVRDLVVFVELALASVLVVLTAMSFAIVSVLQDTEVTFAANELLETRLPRREAERAVERVRGVGGITGVTLASSPPGSRGAPGTVSAPGGRTIRVSTISTGGGFFETTGLAIVRGRPFRPDETTGTAVAVLDESAALAVWPGDDPIGRQVDITVRGRPARVLVIGVARDAIRAPLPLRQPPAVYRPLDLAAESEIVLLARSTRAKEISRHVAGAARSRDAMAPVRVRVVGDAARLVPAEGISVLRLFGAFALIALLLAGSGIFAVVGQSVTQRTAEFGVRLALGATPGCVLRTVLSRELKLILAALATGTIGTVAMTRSSGFDDAAFIVAVNMARPGWGLALIGLCGAVAGLACLLATYRIVKLDPSVVLRKT